MSFVPFPKISESATKLDKPVQRDIAKMKFDIYEKVHGANFSVYCNEKDEIQFAKRTGFLQPDDWFYNYQTIAERLSKHTKAMRHELKLDHVIVYGELCGGFYPSNPSEWKGARQVGRINARGDCPLPVEERAIQEDVYYSPKVEFIVLGMMRVDIKDGSNHWIPRKTVRSICAKIGADALSPFNDRPLTLSQAMAHSPIFESKVAVEIFRQPPLPSGTNRGEGVVLVPDDSWIESTDGDPSRYPMFKHKHSEFAEISGDFNGATPVMQLTSMINPNRLNAVLSKIGRLDSTTKDEVIEAYCNDVWEDFGYERYLPNRDQLEATVRQLVQDAVETRLSV